jgi:hypothetical protein
LVASQSGWATTKEFYPTQPGIWLNPAPECRCDSKCQQQLLVSLRRITGLQQLHFSDAGELKVCDWSGSSGSPAGSPVGSPAGSPAVGSASARALLLRALRSGQAYVVEAYFSSPEVAFGQLDAGLIYEGAEEQQRFTIWWLRLDLEDFKRVEAPAPVRAAFDVGFAFLHELLHGLGYEDAAALNELGSCEELINQVRTELSLPLRTQYFGNVVPITAQVFTVRLIFHDPPPALTAERRTKRRTYRLYFSPEIGALYLWSKEVTTKNFLRRR